MARDEEAERLLLLREPGHLVPGLGLRERHAGSGLGGSPVVTGVTPTEEHVLARRPIGRERLPRPEGVGGGKQHRGPRIGAVHGIECPARISDSMAFMLTRAWSMRSQKSWIDSNAPPSSRACTMDEIASFAIPLIAWRPNRM